MGFAANETAKQVSFLQQKELAIPRKCYEDLHVSHAFKDRISSTGHVKSPFLTLSWATEIESLVLFSNSIK